MGYSAITQLRLVIDFKNKIISISQVFFLFSDTINSNKIHNLTNKENSQIHGLSKKYKKIDLQPDQKLTAKTNVPLFVYLFNCFRKQAFREAVQEKFKL
jgi:hypothetical protein